MNTLKNPTGQILLRLDTATASIVNGAGQSLAYTRGGELLNLSGQCIAHFSEQDVKNLGGQVVCTVEGSAVVNVSGGAIASVEVNSPLAAGALAAAYMFLLSS